MEALAVLGIVLFAAFLAYANSIPRRSQRGSKRRNAGKPKLVQSKESSGKRPQNNWGMSDPRNQLDAVSQVFFEKTRIMNAAEYRVFKALEGIVAEVGGGHRVMAQTSLGEVIKPKSDTANWKTKKDAFASINSKRLDFAVIDANGYVALAVEYQGDGHHQEKAFIRDAVKKEALRRAKVPLLEVEKGTKPSEFQMRVRNALGVEAAKVEAAE